MNNKLIISGFLCGLLSASSITFGMLETIENPQFFIRNQAGLTRVDLINNKLIPLQNFIENRLTTAASLTLDLEENNLSIKKATPFNLFEESSEKLIDVPQYNIKITKQEKNIVYNHTFPNDKQENNLYIKLPNKRYAHINEVHFSPDNDKTTKRSFLRNHPYMTIGLLITLVVITLKRLNYLPANVTEFINKQLSAATAYQNMLFNKTVA